MPIDVDEMSIWVPGQRGDDMTPGYDIATGELRGMRATYAQTQLLSASGVSMLDVKEIRCVAYEKKKEHHKKKEKEKDSMNSVKQH